MLCFVSGMPLIEVGINDRRRRGKEIVRRHEIIPVKVCLFYKTISSPILSISLSLACN